MKFLNKKLPMTKKCSPQNIKDLIIRIDDDNESDFELSKYTNYITYVVLF